jgi:hypothetical protein
MAANRHPRLGSEIRLLELQRQIFAQIGAALHAAAASSASASKDVPKAEELSENVAEILKDSRIDPRLPAPAAQSGVTIAVIHGPLVRVGQHRVSLADFLESFFRIRIIRIPVRMELQRQLAIRALQLHFADCARDAQHFVVIAFCVRRQCHPFS